jgi:hypothetical protein
MCELAGAAPWPSPWPRDPAIADHAGPVSGSVMGDLPINIAEPG